MLFRQEEEKTYGKVTVNGLNYWIIIHKSNHKKGDRHDYDIYKENHPFVTLKQVGNVFDLGYIGVQKDFPEQLLHLYKIERREIRSYLKWKKSITQVILKRGLL